VENERGLGCQRTLDLGGCQAHEVERDAEPLEQFRHEGLRAAVQVVLQHGVIPGLQQGQERGADCRHTHKIWYFLISFNEYSVHMKRTFLIVLVALSAFAQSTPPPPVDTKPGKSFDEVAEKL